MTNQNTTAPAASSVASVPAKDDASPAVEQPKTAPIDPKAAPVPAAKV